MSKFTIQTLTGLYDDWAVKKHGTFGSLDWLDDNRNQLEMELPD